VTLRRRVLTWWRGPLCDFGTAHGATGCLRAAAYTSHIYPESWNRGLRWCEEHRPRLEQKEINLWRWHGIPLRDPPVSPERANGRGE
jgi:hypothetical protein